MLSCGSCCSIWLWLSKAALTVSQESESQRPHAHDGGRARHLVGPRRAERRRGTGRPRGGPGGVGGTPGAGGVVDGVLRGGGRGRRWSGRGQPRAEERRHRAQQAVRRPLDGELCNRDKDGWVMEEEGEEEIKLWGGREGVFSLSRCYTKIRALGFGKSGNRGSGKGRRKGKSLRKL